MVRILANGEIVPDDDPRVRQSPHSGNAATNRAPRMGFVQNTEPQQYGHEGQGAAANMVQNVSIFQTLNQRLLDLGIPRFNIWQYSIEPIVTVGFLLAMLLFGLPGLLFAGLLFAVVMFSGGGEGDNTGGSGSPGSGDGTQRRRSRGRILRHR